MSSKDWKPNPSLEEHTPCEEAATCHFDRFAPIVRRLMHAYFYDPRTQVGLERKEFCDVMEKQIAEAVTDLIDKVDQVCGRRTDPGTIARGLWAVIVLAARRFDQAFTEHPDSYLGTREKGKDWWV